MKSAGNFKMTTPNPWIWWFGSVNTFFANVASMFIRNCEVTDETYTQNATDTEALNLYD